jgi:hypothetical protein
LMDKAFVAERRSHELRKQALEMAERALSDALSRFTQAKRAVEFMETVYRRLSEYTLRNAVGRNLRNRYRETVKALFRARREYFRAQKRHAYASEQAWRRDSMTCPEDEWVWVRAYRRKSRTGKDYIVDGYWRAPHPSADFDKGQTSEKEIAAKCPTFQEKPQMDPSLKVALEAALKEYLCWRKRGKDIHYATELAGDEAVRWYISEKGLDHRIKFSVLIARWRKMGWWPSAFTTEKVKKEFFRALPERLETGEKFQYAPSKNYRRASAVRA